MLRSSTARRNVVASFALLLVLSLPGCAYYSFTGATIPSHLDTVHIPLVEDDSASPFADLDNEVTQMLVERVIRRTRLSLANDEGSADAVLRGRISSYSSEPTAVAGDRGATLNRVTITVEMSMHDQIEDEEMLQQIEFSSFEDYDPQAGSAQAAEEAERLAALAALEDIADNIFTAATSDW